MKNEGRKKHVAVSATVIVLLRIMENKEWYCSNEELQEYIKTDGNRIIWSIIHTYARGLDQDDAYQEALIGVWKALAAYDPKRVDNKKKARSSTRRYTTRSR